MESDAAKEEETVSVELVVEVPGRTGTWGKGGQRLLRRAQPIMLTGALALLSELLAEPALEGVS